MTRASYDPATGTILADLEPDSSHAQVHAGPEGHSVVLHLSPTEAAHLRDQLVQAIRRAELAKHVRPGPA